MRTDKHFGRRSIVLLAAVALAGGCAALNKPYPGKMRYSLGVPVTSSPSTGPAALLRIDRVLVNSPFDDRAFIYRTGETTYETDYYNEFVADPSALLTAATLRSLAPGGAGGAVLPPGGSASTDYKLETTITDLYGDFRPGHPPQAFVRARFILLHDSAEATTVAGEWVLEVAEPVKSTAPADLAAGLGRAYSSIVQQLAGKMAAAIPALPAVTGSGAP